MFILKLYRLIMGIVTISVSGSFCERFLNLAVRRRINFWNVRRRGDTLMMKVSRVDFKKLREIAKASSCKIHIEGKDGLPFIFFRYRKRKALFLGLLVFLAVLFVLSRFIWSVDVIADEGLDREAIKAAAAEIGLHSGTPIGEVSELGLKNELMLRFDDLSYVGISVKGTRATIEARKREQIPDIITGEEPCNIVASEMGQIISIQATVGEKMVIEGEAVLKGQLLIGGIADSNVEGARLLHAQGEVMAKTTYVEEVFVPFVQTERHHTGEVKNLIYVKIFDFKFNLKFWSGNSYTEYDKIAKEWEFEPVKNMVLPIMIEKEDYFEVELLENHLEKGEAEWLGESACDKTFYGKRPSVNLLERSVSYVHEENGIMVKVLYSCLENIAKKERIEVE